MAIYLTKDASKLLEFSIKQTSEVPSNDSWIVHSFLNMGKRLWVVIHEDSGWFFPMQSLKKKQLIHFKETIISYLMYYGTRMYLQPATLRQLSDSIEQADYVNSGRTRMNRIKTTREIVYMHEHLFDKKSLYNLKFMEACNNFYDMVGNNFQPLFKNFISSLQREDHRPIQIQAYEATVFLHHEHLEDTVYRHLMIPSHISFGHLAISLMKVFRYEQVHLHRFLCFNENKELEVSFVSQHEIDMGLAMEEFEFNENNYCLEDVLPLFPYVIFEYNYSASWKHLVVIHDITEDYPSLSVSIIKAEGLAPLDLHDSFEEYEHDLNRMDEKNLSFEQKSMEFNLERVKRMEDVLWVLEGEYKQLPMMKVDSVKMS